MAIDKSLISGNTDMLILKLLEKQDMYGYQMIEELAKQSDHTFELKAGTLYPLLHLLEQKQYLVSYDGETVAGKTRKYYRITDEGKRFLVVRLSEWESYSAAVNKVLSGGCFACRNIILPKNISRMFKDTFVGAEQRLWQQESFLTI